MGLPRERVRSITVRNRQNTQVVTLILDDVDWRASVMLVRAKGRQRARMPISPDVGAVAAYLRNSRPKSSCRCLFLRTLAPQVGSSSGCAATLIAMAALDRVGIEGCASRCPKFSCIACRARSAASSSTMNILADMIGPPCRLHPRRQETVFAPAAHQSNLPDQACGSAVRSKLWKVRRKFNYFEYLPRAVDRNFHKRNERRVLPPSI